MDLKEIFAENALNFEQFMSAVDAKGIKLADLSKGDYVSKHKFDDEVKSRDNTIADLNGQLATRDSDIAKLTESLSNTNTDNKTKVAELSSQLEKLKSDYDKAKTDYTAKLERQAFEFAVREYANSKEFSSGAAKRDFIREMENEKLTMKDNAIIGADDFTKLYAENNPDAFVVKEPESDKPKPTFGQPTPPSGSGSESTPFAFNFRGVR